MEAQAPLATEQQLSHRAVMQVTAGACHVPNRPLVSLRVVLECWRATCIARFVDALRRAAAAAVACDFALEATWTREATSRAREWTHGDARALASRVAPNALALASAIVDSASAMVRL